MPFCVGVTSTSRLFLNKLNLKWAWLPSLAIPLVMPSSALSNSEGSSIASFSSMAQMYHLRHCRTAAGAVFPFTFGSSR